MPSFPIDFDALRVAIVREVQLTTALTCIVADLKQGMNLPRPALPYFTMKITTPAARYGFDSTQPVSGYVTVRGGPRRMSVSFQVFTQDQETAYNYMTLLQSAFDLFTVQARLREAGIAIWTIGTVADLTSLLNTGYEARAQMDVQFGIAANLTEDTGAIESVSATGNVLSGLETIEQIVNSP